MKLSERWPRVPAPARQVWTPHKETTMFLMLSKGPRKTNRTKTRRFRAKLKAKNRGRRNRIYVRS